jgi:hypothetical protein
MSQSRNVIEPTKGEWEGLSTLTHLLAWARIGGEVNMPGSKSGTLLVALGADADVRIEDIASIDPDDFEDALASWLIGPPDTGAGVDIPQVSPSAIDKGRARALHKACRIFVGLEYSKADTEEWAWQNSQREALAQAERTKAISQASTVAPQPVKMGRSVKVAEVADVTKAVEVPVLDAATITEAFAEYLRKMHIEPRPEIEPSVEQLSALHDILANGSCYVDLSIWGPHHIRILKAMKLSGLIMSANGELVLHEFKGPPDFEHWKACWDVFQTAMVMLKACNPAFLIAYSDFIGRYSKRYGQKCLGSDLSDRDPLPPGSHGTDSAPSKH